MPAPKVDRGHRIGYVRSAGMLLTAECSCGTWRYSNTVHSDVRQQAKWHRESATRVQP